MVGMFGFVNRTLSWQAWVLILPIVYAIYRCYQLYLDRLENQRRQAEDERRHREEVAELLTQSIAANAALRRANEDLEQFAYAASHDLQEPVRMISLYGELLQRRHQAELSPECKQLLGTINDGAHRINELIRDLLSYTKTANADNAAPSTSDPVEVLGDVRQALMERITSLDAVITFENLAPVRVHRTHLLQLLQNLLSNSLKYHSPERQLRIHITTAQAADGMTELMVRDNGIGIDLAYHERIFGVFKRLHSRRVPGTGIGLAICKKIVQHYDGRIWVESGPGEGSTFHLTLPTGDAYGQFTNSGLIAGASDQRIVEKKPSQGVACVLPPSQPTHVVCDIPSAAA
jgi:light-regulated signal transduction histidine kinase (bacteriophytochrome)